VIPQPSFMIVGGLCRRALFAPAAVLVSPGRAMQTCGAVGSARKIGAAVRAESAGPAVLVRADRSSAVLARGISAPASVSSAVVAVGIAAATRCHQVLGCVVRPIAVKVVGAQRRPGEGAAAPVTGRSHSTELVVENEPANRDFAVLGRKGMGRQVAGWPRVTHTRHFSPAWRTTDPGERARALGVPKPPPVIDGQLDMFGGAA